MVTKRTFQNIRDFLRNQSNWIWNMQNEAFRVGMDSVPIFGVEFTDTRRAEVMALFLSDVLLLHVIGFRQYKTKRNFSSSYLEKPDMSYI